MRYYVLGVVLLRAFEVLLAALVLAAVVSVLRRYRQGRGPRGRPR